LLNNIKHAKTIKMKKKVKKFGNSLCITLDTEDKDIYDIEKDDFIDIEIKKVIKHKPSEEQEATKKPKIKTKAIIVAAGKGARLGGLLQEPKCMLEIGGKTILRRAIDTFKACGINDIIIVRGYEKDKISYSDVRYYEDRDPQGILSSLMVAEKEMSDEFIFTYSDILFKKSIIEKVLQSKADIALVIDTDWISHYVGRTDHPIAEAENVIILGDKVTRIGKNLSAEESHGEFIGIAKFSKKGANALREVYRSLKKRFKGKLFHEAREFEKAYLTDMIQELINRGYNVAPVKIKGGWHELDTLQDLGRLSLLYRL